MKKVLYPILGVVMLSMFIISGCQNKPMGNTAKVPVGRAYAEGKEIYFTHTEASDSEIAQMLTDMMDSPVFYVPSLAQVPDSALANVYAFSNGLEGMGPLGFQPDVFDNPPGSDGYTPLRRLNVVNWVEPENATELKSAEAVLAAEQAGAVTIEQPGIVINMPFIVWDGGTR
jgi:hypothetical protein